MFVFFFFGLILNFLNVNPFHFIVHFTLFNFYENQDADVCVSHV